MKWWLARGGQDEWGSVITERFVLLFLDLHLLHVFGNPVQTTGDCCDVVRHRHQAPAPPVVAVTAISFSLARVLAQFSFCYRQNLEWWPDGDEGQSNYEPFLV